MRPTLIALLILVGALGADAQASFDRSTPRRAVSGFVAALERGEPRAASELLAARAETAERSARAGELGTVLRGLAVDARTLPDVPATEEGERVALGTIELDTVLVVVELEAQSTDGALRWVLPARLVERLPALAAAADAPPFGLSAWWGRGRIFDLAPWQLCGLVLAVLLAAVLGRGIAAIGLRIATAAAARTESKLDDDLVTALRGPTRFAVGVAALAAVLPTLRLPPSIDEGVDRFSRVLLVAAVAWLAHRLVGVVAAHVQRRALRRLDEPNGGPARAVRTRVLILRRIAGIVVGTVSVAAVLLQFEIVRTVGMSLLASAGIAGVVVGLAAQRSIGTLLAGLQLSITQPFRLGDTVVVEGSWGTIEEINLTYVVVKIWDERRLVVPMSTFLETSFENWTKGSPELLGTVFLHADATVPLSALRAELKRVVEADPRWDRRVQSLVVTEAQERTLQLRALVSARNADDQWDLRCVVREKLVAWLAAADGGAYLPRVRLEDPSTRSPKSPLD